MMHIQKKNGHLGFLRKRQNTVFNVSKGITLCTDLHPQSCLLSTVSTESTWMLPPPPSLSPSAAVGEEWLGEGAFKKKKKISLDHGILHLSFFPLQKYLFGPKFKHKGELY